MTTWGVLGWRRRGYSPTDQAISRLAEKDAPTRVLMTGGFLAYGVGLIAYGTVLRHVLPGSAGTWAIATGAATLVVAAFPLGTPVAGTVHAVFAVAGYVSLAAIPATAAPALAKSGAGKAAALSAATAVATASFLFASTIGAPAHGLTQRIGLTVGDCWVAVSAAAVARQLGR